MPGNSVRPLTPPKADPRQTRPVTCIVGRSGSVRHPPRRGWLHRPETDQLESVQDEAQQAGKLRKSTRLDTERSRRGLTAW